ncbi:DNA polymerase III subunit delta [Buchananella felis]|uniref:DNA polymerase III subunit delta n=1 Tax=Buchananella felis TaxID=3231492 RepID=UPI00352942A3
MCAAKKTASVSWEQATLAPVVLIRCGEPLLADRAQSALLRQARQADPQVEVTQLDAATYEVGTLSVVTSPSLFGERRLILIPDLELASDALIGDALAYVAAPEPDVWLVARHNGGQRGKKLLDAIAASYPVVAGEQIKSQRDKAAFVEADVRRAGFRIDPDAVQALVDALGSDLRELSAAVAQLLSDVSASGVQTVTAAHVSRYYSGRIEATGYSVADAAVAGRAATALKLLRHALATGVRPNMIVGALAAKVRLLARLSAGPHVSARELGMQPWMVDRAKREAAQWSEPGLAAAIRAVAAADAEVKGGGKDGEYAVERAITRICEAHGRRPNPALKLNY